MLWKIPECYREAHSTIVQLYLCPLTCKLSSVSLLTDRTLLAPPLPILFASAIDLQKMALLNQHNLLQLFEILVLWAMNVRHILSLPAEAFALLMKKMRNRNRHIASYPDIREWIDVFFLSTSKGRWQRIFQGMI